MTKTESKFLTNAGRAFKTLAVSLMALTMAPTSQAGEILIVLSDEDHLELKGTDVYATGFYLNELMQPVKMFLDAGHDLTFATPKGNAPTVDAVSENVLFFGSQEALDAHKGLLLEMQITDPEHSPVISLHRVAQIGYDAFDALYVPGGHAPMNDLLKDPSMAALLRHFHQDSKITALVCHGPIALLSTLPNNEDFIGALENGKETTADSEWIYAGYKMTVFSNQEELAAQAWLGGGKMKFFPQDALDLAGGLYSEASELWAPNVVVDRELITGQNPASAIAVALAILERLE